MKKRQKSSSLLSYQLPWYLNYLLGSVPKIFMWYYRNAEQSFFTWRVEISVSIKRTNLPGFTVLQGLGQFHYD